MNIASFISAGEGDKVNRAEWSRRFGVTRGYLTQLAKGTRMPSLQTAYKIEQVTGGKVRMQDWITPEGDTGGTDLHNGLRGSDTSAIQATAAAQFRARGG